MHRGWSGLKQTLTQSTDAYRGERPLQAESFARVGGLGMFNCHWKQEKMPVEEALCLQVEPTAERDVGFSGASCLITFSTIYRQDYICPYIIWGLGLPFLSICGNNKPSFSIPI